MRLLVVHGPWSRRLWWSSRCTLEDEVHYIFMFISFGVVLLHFGTFIFSFFLVVWKVFTCWNSGIGQSKKQRFSFFFPMTFIYCKASLTFTDLIRVSSDSTKIGVKRDLWKTMAPGCSVGHFGGEISTLGFRITYLRWKTTISIMSIESFFFVKQDYNDILVNQATKYESI